MAQTPDYRKMTKTQLTALARRKKIPVKAGLLKEELVKALKKGLRKIEAQKKSKPKAATKKKVATKKRKPAAAAKKKVAAKKKTAKTSKTRTVRKTTPVPEAFTSPRGTRFFKPPSSWSR